VTTELELTKVDITEVHAGLLPQDKAAAMQELERDGGRFLEAIRADGFLRR
jgi:cation transport ATPase